MFFPHSNKTITLAAHFPDLESRDKFFESQRSIFDAMAAGLDFLFVPPNAEFEKDEKKRDEEDNDDLHGEHDSELAKKLGVTNDELYQAFLLGANSLIRYYIKVYPPNLLPFLSTDTSRAN